MKRLVYGKRKKIFVRIAVGIVKLVNFLLSVRNMFVLIFTGVTPLISNFLWNEIHFYFAIQFFLYNSFYFTCLLSGNAGNVNFQCLLSLITGHPQ